MAENILPKSIAEIIKMDWGHIKLNLDGFLCANCGQTSKSPRRSQSLKNHLYTFFGFANMHKNCKPGEPSEEAKLLMV